jgi:putative Mg2+ transporter-C (MgtC) family protein
MGIADYPFADWQTVIMVVAEALLLGAIIGLDREKREKPAGLRTHALVSVAAAVAMLATLALAEVKDHDPIRAVGAVLTGIGFLGAGTIMRHGELLRGLTTGATIWAAGVIGVSAGLMWHAGAVVGTVAVVIILQGLKWVERRLDTGGEPVVVTGTLRGDQPLPLDLIKEIKELRFELRGLHIDEHEGAGHRLEMHLRAPDEVDPAAVALLMRGFDALEDVRCRADEYEA